MLLNSMDSCSGGSKPSDKGGGPVIQTLRYGGGGCWSPKKFFSALWASVWSKNKGGVGPSRGSTTELAVSSLDFEQSLFC